MSNWCDCFGKEDVWICSDHGRNRTQVGTVTDNIPTCRYRGQIKIGGTLSENLVQDSKLKQQAIIPSTATLALPSIDLVPVNSGNRPVIVSNPSTCNTFMDHLQDIDIGDILGELSSNAPLPIQNRQTNMQSKPQIFYGNVIVIHNLTINK
jgi:hypothetical protein